MKEPVKVKIIRKKPTGYLVELLDSNQQVQIARLAFEKRVDMGLYEVTNPTFFSAALSDY